MADDEFRVRRIRSISVSLECAPAATPPLAPLLLGATVAECRRPAPCKSMTLNSRTSSSILPVKEQRGIGAKINDLFNFVKSKCFSSAHTRLQGLPDNAKVHIFSFLDQKSKARLMLVCKEWNMLLRCPRLWNWVDFSIIHMCHHAPSRDCLLHCYPAYKKRVKLYATHINNIKPSIKFLKFSLDMGDFEDGWKEMVMSLMVVGRLRELKSAELNWKETQAKKSLHSSRCTSATWSDTELRHFSVNRRSRQRIFFQLFDVFTAVAPHLQHLSLPFDWCDHNIQAFSRLENLLSLRLDLYFSYYCVSQDKLSHLLSLLPHLRSLSLEFWMESDLGFHQYSLHAPLLTTFDISLCKGVYFQKLHMPSLLVFHTSRSPRRWPFDYGQSHNPLACLFQILSEGAPNLRLLNQHPLQQGWREGGDEGLEVVLRQVCPCCKHDGSEVVVGGEGGI